MSGTGSLPRKNKIAFIGPLVWGSVWGHGPELSRFLCRRNRVVYFDPLVPPRPSKSSFIDRNSYPVPDGMELVRRKCPFRPGIFYGLLMEWRNLWAVAGSGARAMVTYYPAGTLMALLWCRLSGRRSLFIYADRPDIIDCPIARLASRLCIRATAWLASAGSVATSAPLLEDLRGFTSRAVLVPNGVDLARAGLDTSAPGENREEDKFSVTFAGAFGEWVDFKLVLETATACSWARFVLIGDGPQWDKVKSLAAGLDNVELTGPMPHSEVFARLADSTVCLVPFKINGLTDRVSPVKLFEYWAMGRPVVATPCLEISRLAEISPDALYLAGDSEGTVELLERFRDEPRMLAASSRAAREAVKSYDWNRLGNKILNILLP